MICVPCGNGDHKNCEDRKKKARLYRSCPCHHVERPKAPEPEVTQALTQPAEYVPTL